MTTSTHPIPDFSPGSARYGCGLTLTQEEALAIVRDQVTAVRWINPNDPYDVRYSVGEPDWTS